MASNKDDILKKEFAMKISERYALEIGQIESDIELLKNRQIREIQGAGPYSSVDNLGLRLEDEFKKLIAKIDADTISDLEIVARTVNNQR